MSPFKNFEYAQLLSRDGFEEYDEKHWETIRNRTKARTHWLLLAAVLLSSFLTFLLTRTFYLNDFWRRAPIEHLAALDSYSPLFKSLDLRMEYKTTGGELWGNETNIWRQDPSAEVDAAWNFFDESRYILLAKSEVEQMGLPTETAVKWPTSSAEDVYVGDVDVYHVMHCLNEMRRNAYHNFPHYFDEQHLNPIHWDHWSHCLDMLRQEIMCSASLHAHMMVWQEGLDVPFPAFETNRKCRSWDDIDDWVEKHRLNEEQKPILLELKKPEGVKRPTPSDGMELLHRNTAWMREMQAKGYKFVHDLQQG